MPALPVAPCGWSDPGGRIAGVGTTPEPVPGQVVRGALGAVRRVVSVQGVLFGAPRAEPWVVTWAVWCGPRWGWRRAGEALIRSWRAWAGTGSVRDRAPGSLAPTRRAHGSGRRKRAAG